MIKLFSKFYKFLLRKYYVYCINHLIKKSCFIHAMFLFDKYREIVPHSLEGKSYNEVLKERF